MDRKDFFKEAFTIFSRKISETKSFGSVEKAVTTLEQSFKKKERPPGAHPDQFQALCTGCDACMAACPINIIMIEDLEKRYPIIYPEEGPCLHCDGYPCIQSCPTEALTLEFGVR